MISEDVPRTATRREIRDRKRRLGRREVRRRGKETILEMLKMRGEGYSDIAIAAAVGFRPSEVQRILSLVEDSSASEQGEGG